jgi:hypothetical protein
MKTSPWFSLCLGACALACGCGSTDAPPGSGVDAGCPAPTSGPTNHPGTVGTETWTAAGSPHKVPLNTNISGTLTIEPCAEVLIGGQLNLSVEATGKLVAEGLSNKPIHIGAIDPAKPFAKISTHNGGSARLAYVNIDGCGDPLNIVPDLTGAIDLQGSDGTLPTQPILFVDHVTISGSKSNGIVARDGAGFAPGSTALTITGSAQFPMSVWSRAIDGIPPGSYSGNAKDEILIPATGLAESMKESATMHERGVPYRIGNQGSAGTLYVGSTTTGAAVATLTIEPGVIVRVKKGGVIYIESSSLPAGAPARGALIAVGTAAKPIVFTSLEPSPAAGDWKGIWFNLIPDANDKMDYTRVEYAGGANGTASGACNTPGPNDGAIRIFGLPAGQFVTNTTILSSLGHGVDRGWRDNSKPDFLATNTFTSIAKCKQSYPKDTNGGCPTTVPCP